MRRKYLAVRAAVLIGGPVRRILEVLDAEAAALVVIGSRGRGTLRSAVLGSVSSRLGAKAPCPCVIIPPGATGHQLPT